MQSENDNQYSGCSVARLSRRVWDAEVAGSNPATPTSIKPSLSLDNGGFSSLKGSAVSVAVSVKTPENNSIVETFGLIKKDEFQNMPKFKKAEIVRSKASKGDYVKFYIWDAQKNELVKYPINQF